MKRSMRAWEVGFGRKFQSPTYTNVILKVLKGAQDLNWQASFFPWIPPRGESPPEEGQRQALGTTERRAGAPWSEAKMVLTRELCPKINSLLMIGGADKEARKISEIN